MVALLASLFLSIFASLFFYRISYIYNINLVSHHKKPTIIRRKMVSPSTEIAVNGYKKTDSVDSKIFNEAL